MKLPHWFTADRIIAACSVAALAFSGYAVHQVEDQRVLVADQLMVGHVDQLNNFAATCVDSSPVLSKQFALHLCSARKLAMQITATNMLRATILEGGTRLSPVALRSIKDGLDVQLLSEIEAAAAIARDDESLCRTDAEFRAGLRRTLMAHYLLDKPRDEAKNANRDAMDLEATWDWEKQRHSRQLNDSDPILAFRARQFLQVAAAVDLLKSICNPA
jgi:hypothetical protein